MTREIEDKKNEDGTSVPPGVCSTDNDPTTRSSGGSNKSKPRESSLLGPILPILKSSAAKPSALGSDDWRHEKDSKVVGLKHYGMNKSLYDKRHQFELPAGGGISSEDEAPSESPGDISSRKQQIHISVEQKEVAARANVTRNPFVLLVLGNVAALKVMMYYLITLETMISCCATVALTIYWYYAYSENTSWTGGSLDFVLLAFSLTAPISAAMSMAFNRRERALVSIADFRSWSYHLYLGHSLWDWSDDKGGRAGADVDWVEHCDAVMAQLIGIGDELARFLTLPTTSRSRHRMTHMGRAEAAKTIEVAYHLLESMTTQRMTRLIFYSERLKKIGLPSGEISRLRQFERFISNTIEQLRMVKMYRTPQAFRSFARIFTLILPPFYAPTYAQVGKDVNSLGVGIAFGIITAVGLTALFESLQILEDPFVAFLALDGIDVREEFEVLHYAQLTNTRKLIFPNAPAYPAGRRVALTGQSKKPTNAIYAVGLPPTQLHHHHHHVHGKTTNHSDTSLDLNTQYSLAKEVVLSFDDDQQQVVDLELGSTVEGTDSTFSRETGFADTDDLDVSRPSLDRQATVRSRRHTRDWSYG